jgi:Xrn1 helical domain
MPACTLHDTRMSCLASSTCHLRSRSQVCVCRSHVLPLQGVTDWTWYYPFHYAPFASDLLDCDAYELKSGSSQPFRWVVPLLTSTST